MVRACRPSTVEEDSALTQLQPFSQYIHGDVMMSLYCLTSLPAKLRRLLRKTQEFRLNPKPTAENYNHSNQLSKERATRDFKTSPVQNKPVPEDKCVSLWACHGIHTHLMTGNGQRDIHTYLALAVLGKLPDCIRPCVTLQAMSILTYAQHVMVLFF